MSGDDNMETMQTRLSRLLRFLRAADMPPDAATLTALMAAAAQGAVYAHVPRQTFIDAAGNCYDSALESEREDMH